MPAQNVIKSLAVNGDVPPYRAHISGIRIARSHQLIAEAESLISESMVLITNSADLREDLKEASFESRTLLQSMLLRDSPLVRKYE